GQRKNLRQSIGPRHLARAPSHYLGVVSAVHGSPANLLHLRRHPHPNRTRLRLSLLVRLRKREVALDFLWRNSVRLLAGVGSLSGRGPSFRLASRRGSRRLVPQLHGFHGPLE